MRCHLGDFAEYWALRAKARRDPRGGPARDASGRAPTRSARRVDDAPAGRRDLTCRRPSGAGSPWSCPRRDGKPDRALAGPDVLPALGAGLRGTAGRADADPAAAIGERRSARYRRDVAAKLVSLHVQPPKAQARRVDPKVEREAAKLEDRAAAHPCHACPERAEARAVGRARRRSSSSSSAASSVGSGCAPRRSRASSTACSRCSTSSGTSTAGRSPTRGGRLVADLRRGRHPGRPRRWRAGLLDGLTPAEVAALLSTIVYEGRERVPLAGRDADPGDGGTVSSASRGSGARSGGPRTSTRSQLCRELEDRGSRSPIFHWAGGEPLEDGAAARPRWRPATSSATASSSSTCCVRSRRSRRRRPPASCAPRRLAVVPRRRRVHGCLAVDTDA